MKALRIGSRGKDVERWQQFLLGQGFEIGLVDGVFGPMTEEATRDFQRSQRLEVDGVVGNQTLGAAMVLGLPVVASSERPSVPTSVNYPPPPRFKPLSARGRAELFGHFEYAPAPREGFPEGIRILGSWQRQNIVTVSIPALDGIRGAPANTNVSFHRAAADQLRALFAAWQLLGSMPQVLTWDGSFVPRFVRGSRSVLSNHAWGTAFDINARWNALGTRPALIGQRGSVRELVEVANQHGFYWGGHFPNRPDGMHFECVKLL
jgi:hypothetical protein